MCARRLFHTYTRRSRLSTTLSLPFIWNFRLLVYRKYIPKKQKTENKTILNKTYTMLAGTFRICYPKHVIILHSVKKWWGEILASPALYQTGYLAYFPFSQTFGSTGWKHQMESFQNKQPTLQGTHLFPVQTKITMPFAQEFFFHFNLLSCYVYAITASSQSLPNYLPKAFPLDMEYFHI